MDILTPITALILLSLFLFGVFYSALVRWLRNAGKDGAQTPWLVVVGNVVVAGGFSAIVGLNPGTPDWLHAFFLLLLCNAAPGVAMIIEHVTWTPPRQRNHASLRTLEELTK